MLLWPCPTLWQRDAGMPYLGYRWLRLSLSRAWVDSRFPVIFSCGSQTNIPPLPVPETSSKQSGKVKHLRIWNIVFCSKKHVLIELAIFNAIGILSTVGLCVGHASAQSSDVGYGILQISSSTSWQLLQNICLDDSWPCYIPWDPLSHRWLKGIVGVHHCQGVTEWKMGRCSWHHKTNTANRICETVLHRTTKPPMLFDWN